MGNKGIYGDTPETIISNSECRINEKLKKLLAKQNEKFDEIIKRIEKIEETFKSKTGDNKIPKSKANKPITSTR